MTDLDSVPVTVLTLPAGTTVGEAIERLAGLDPDDRFVGPHRFITASIPPEPVAQPADEPDPVAEALAIPHLPEVARHLRKVRDRPGRPKIQDAGIALRRDIRRPAADRIASALAGLPWPPDWLPALPEPAAESDR